MKGSSNQGLRNRQELKNMPRVGEESRSRANSRPVYLSRARVIIVHKFLTKDPSMAFDKELADRVRANLTWHGADLSERKMFGGLCFMVRGSMICGVMGSEVILRVGPEQHEWALQQEHTRVFDFTGKPSRGFIYLEAEAIATEETLSAWIEHARTK